MTAVRPSPARAEAPEPDVWIPILDLELLEALGSQIDPFLVRELEGLELVHFEPAAAATATPITEAPPAVELVAELLPLPPPPEVVVGTAVAGQPHHRFMHWVILAVAMAVVAAGVPYFLRSPAQRRVTLDVDGASFARTTRLDDVGGLLTAAGVALSPGDQVTPAPSSTLRDGTTVRVVRAFPVTVDVNGAARSVNTTATTVKALRRTLGIPAAMVAVGAPDRLRRDDRVVFRTPFAVTLITDGMSGALTSTARTVGELLAERGVQFVAGDQIDPGLDTPLAAGLAITVTHTSAGRVTEDTAVPFAVQERPDASLADGQRRVVQAGVDGTDRTTYQLTRDGDTVVGKQALGTVHVSAAQAEITAVGTQPLGAHQQSGTATWYATLHQPGTCAHLTIPFGTVVRVTDTDAGTSTTCRVADRGPEAWTGNLIDLSPDVFEQLQPLSAGVIAHVRLDY
jgi:resuscitation-promoting factor RpfB